MICSAQDQVYAVHLVNCTISHEIDLSNSVRRICKKVDPALYPIIGSNIQVHVHTHVHIHVHTHVHIHIHVHYTS